MSESPTANVFAQEMSRQNHTVVSPDGQITVAVAAGSVKGVRFAPGAYRGYDDTELGGQLVHVARLVWVTRERSRREAMRAVRGDPRAAIADRVPRSAAERRLLKLREREKVEVKSANLRIGVTGGGTWAIHIRPGTVRELSEEEFLAELIQLVKHAIGAWQSTMNRLRRECFGPSEILRSLKHSRRT